MVDEGKKGYIGPTCDKCGRHRAILIPILERKETMYGYEMVKVHLCIYHFVEIMENYEELYPDDIQDLPQTPPDDGNEEDEDEDKDEWDSSGVICEGDDCIYNKLGICAKGTEIKLIKYAVGSRGPLFLCDSYIKRTDSKR